MGSGSAALLWYACCSSFVLLAALVAVSLTVTGRRRDAKRRQARLAMELAAMQQAAARNADVKASDEEPGPPGTPPEQAKESPAEDR